MSSTLTKASSCLLILAIVLISNTEGSCWRYGHSCWGGHGKRSGGGSRVPIVGIRKISQHNSSPSDGLAPQYQELANSQQQQQQANIMGMDSSSSEVSGRDDFPYIPGRSNGVFNISSYIFPKRLPNCLLEDEIPVLKRGRETEEDVPMVEISDYDQSNDASLLPVVAHTRKAGLDPEVALALDRPDSYESLRNSMESQEVIKRTIVGDIPRRRSPNDKLLLYKLVRVLRKK